MRCKNSAHGSFLVDNDGRPHLISAATAAQFVEEHQSGINRLKSFLKRYPRLYYAVWYVVCPVLLSGSRPQSVRRWLKDKAIVVDLGSGPRRSQSDFITVDVFSFDEVDIVAEANNLPFKDGSLDAVVNESLLEHVQDPRAVVREIVRVLKPSGMLYASVPFLTPYHASPDDFNRWTKSGLRKLFSEFEPVEEGVDAGPWSAFLVFLAYWLGVVFSFGSKSLATKLAFVFMIILGPLKIFDFLFSRLPGADTVAAQLYFIGRKK